MIKLTRSPAPEFLTEEKVAELLARFNNSKEPVWNVEQIKTPLLNSSHGKCAYCECSLTEESKYMEVEHFKCKALFPHQVVDWFNLLPACKKCNAEKGSHDVTVEQIVNPYDDLPREHFSLMFYTLCGLSEKGRNTLGAIDLNDSKRSATPRFNIGTRVFESIRLARERYENFLADSANEKLRIKLVNLVEGILKECQPNSEYAATAATVALTNRGFIDLIEAMRSTADLWPDPLGELYAAASDLVLPAG